MALYTLSSDRTADWSPGTVVGVTGGIPTNLTTPVNVTLTPYFADNTGLADASTAINNALNNAISGQVVYAPAGTYKCLSSIQHRKTGVIFRGAGSTTIIDSRATYGIDIGYDPGYDDTAYDATATIFSGLTKGSTSITVVAGSIAPFTANRLAIIAFTSGGTPPVINPQRFEYTRRITVLITNVVGNVLTLARPFPNDFSSYPGAFIRQTQVAPFTGIGIESLRITGVNTTYPNQVRTGIIFSGNTVESWVKAVSVDNVINYGIQMENCMGLELYRNVLHGPGGVGGNNGAGFLSNSTTYTLVEQNLADSFQPAVELNAGTVNCVYAYNKFYNCTNDFGFDCNHNSHNSHNLMEGNIMPNIHPDGFFGSVSDHTYFRNWFQQRNNGVTPYYAAKIDRFAWDFSIVGNIIQTAGFSYVDDGFYLGYPNIGNTSSTGTADWSTTFPYDWDTGTRLPKTWTGTLTTRTDAQNGIVTLGTGQGTSFALHKTKSLTGMASMTWTGNSVGIQQVVLGAIVGDVVPININSAYTLPAGGISITFAPSPDGFQERDLNVAASLIRKGNYYVFYTGIPAGESLGALTLADSWFRSSKPASWGSLPWPAFDASTPVFDESRTPTGYYYLNGVWPDDTVPTALNRRRIPMRHF